MNILSVDHLSKSYGRIQALKDLSFEVKSGQAFGILGPNGSGKTTTLGIILSILKQDSGNFEWFEGQYGVNPRLHIGSILETPNFYPYLNAVENLEIVRHIKKSSEKNFDEILDMVELSQRKHSPFYTYSLGMKQRLAIAATMVGDPDVLIFDEPTNGLDPQGIADVRNMLKMIAQSGKTVIMASHILDEVEKICSHVAIMKKGHLMAIGPVGSILSNDIVLELSCTNNTSLMEFLKTQELIKSVEMKSGFIECIADPSTDVAVLSERLFQMGFVLLHMVVRKQKLEEEFLQIIKES